MVVVGAKPTESEQRFVDNFDAWLKACAKFGVDPSPKIEATTEPAPADRKSRRAR
jgi:hypothetical protein